MRTLSLCGFRIIPSMSSESTKLTSMARFTTWEYLNLAVSMIFILAGSHTLFYTASALGAIIGMALLATGTVFISYRIHKLYLWN